MQCRSSATKEEPARSGPPPSLLGATGGAGQDDQATYPTTRSRSVSPATATLAEGARRRCCILGSTNPCRITRKEFPMKQTKMDICTLEEFILVDTWIHCCASWNWICIGNAVVYIQSQQWKRNVRIALRSQLTCED